MESLSAIEVLYNTKNMLIKVNTAIVELIELEEDFEPDEFKKQHEKLLNKL